MREDLPPITTFLNRLLALTIDLQNTLFGVFEDLLRTRIEGAIASGTYDSGVETLTAESLIVTDRRTLYVHPQTGAETQIFTIRRRERNHPFTLADALERAGDPRALLLVNSQVRARRRAGPGAEPDARRRRGRTPRAAAAPDGAHRDPARRRWRRRIGRKPTATPSPAPGRRNSPRSRPSPTAICTSSPACCCRSGSGCPMNSMRVYRLQTDAGERIIGRLVSPAWVAQAADAETPTIAAADAWTAVLDGRTVLDLQEGLQLRRAKVMGEFRVELTGFTDGMVDRLKAIGLISEIISWKLRLFVPTGANGPVDPRCVDGTLPARPHRGSGGGVRRPPCRHTPPTWPTVSRAMPRRCAATISPTAIAKAATGWSAMSPTRRVAACSSG